MSNGTKFSFPEIAILVLRISVGIVFIYHGSQKLFGVFGGHGMEGFIQYLTQLKVPTPEINGWLAALTEFFGGLALAIGFYPRWAALPLIGVMLVAIILVTGANGFNAGNKGFEYNFILIAALLAVFLQGSGKWVIKFKLKDKE